MSYRVCVVPGCVRLSSQISEFTATYLVWRATSAQQVTGSAGQPASIATARRRLSSKRRIYSGRARTENENGKRPQNYKTSQNSSRILFICHRPRCALNDNSPLQFTSAAQRPRPNGCKEVKSNTQRHAKKQGHERHTTSTQRQATSKTFHRRRLLIRQRVALEK